MQVYDYCKYIFWLNWYTSSTIRKFIYNEEIHNSAF